MSSQAALGEVVLPFSILLVEFAPQVAEAITKLTPISSTKGSDVEDNVSVVERLGEKRKAVAPLEALVSGARSHLLRILLL